MNYLKTFPKARMRRSRQFGWSRALMRENSLSASDLIWPVFITESNSQKQAITSMPGVYRYSIDELLKAARHAHNNGIVAIALFAHIESNLKDPTGSIATNADNLICRAVRALKASIPNLGLICDVALDPYTSHGHDGILDTSGYMANDATIEILCQQALCLVQAGADVIAPSDMTDGRIGAIRQHLDNHGFENTIILSYAAKFASNFYGPYRDAVGSASMLGGANKSTYQQDFCNANESLHEVALDIQEGADWVLIKPGMPYLDIIAKIKSEFMLPTFAYQVSGEYAMLVGLANQANLDINQLLYESLIGFKRAGADAILTYAAVQMAEFLAKQGVPSKSLAKTI